MKRILHSRWIFWGLTMMAMLVICMGFVLLSEAFEGYDMFMEITEIYEKNQGKTFPLYRITMHLVMAGSLFSTGTIILTLLLFWILRKSRYSQKEIEELQEKNKEMEAINQKMQQMAHHQRLEIIGMLTSGIAHEFNNMLTPIMGYSMMILEKLPQDDTELYDEVLEIYQMSTKAKNVVSRLSDLSRKNSSNVYKNIFMDELVRRMIATAKPARPNHVDVQLELKCPGVAVRGNETQLSQMLLNLILNSYQALEKKGGILEILTDYDESLVYVKVRDNGEGISEENLPRVFDPFFTTKEAGKGTGLGMSIVAQVVEEHQGSIKIDSSVGKGTVVTTSFPKLIMES